ncbi:MAG: tetratricopeptide repeat protein [Gemmatimonadota bacterium]
MIAQDEGRGRSGGQELATSTLAEIYAQQGLLERARAIYERIAQRTPDDPRVAERLDALSRAIRDRSGAAPPAGPAVEARREPAVEDDTGGDPRASGDPAPDEVFEAWLRRR